MHRFRQLYAPAFGDLQYRAKTFDDIHAGHGERHAAFGQEAGGEAAAAEIFMNRRAPFGGREAGVGFLLADFPVRLHGWLAFRIALFAGAVQRRRTGVDQVDDAVLRQPGERLSGDAFYRFRRPVGAHVGKYLSGAGQLVAHQHCHAVEAVVFRGDDKGFAYAVPVERAIEQRFGGIAVGVLIGPVALALKTRSDGVIAQ